MTRIEARDARIRAEAEAKAEERDRCAHVAASMSLPIKGTPYQAGCGPVAAAIHAGGE